MLRSSVPALAQARGNGSTRNVVSTAKPNASYGVLRNVVWKSMLGTCLASIGIAKGAQLVAAATNSVVASLAQPEAVTSSSRM